jgi:hypothetical protein
LLLLLLHLDAESADVWSIHREAPEFTEQSTEQEILATGIKVRCMAAWLRGSTAATHAAWQRAHLALAAEDAARLLHCTFQLWWWKVLSEG